ncbi:hypothetical protein L7E55_04075 [Pelotomaculum isophthalicicum JI]|uniref:Uncharacterized protein n=1 Tax=Pelotomaculum isophthalicicum JI TaxID=947010 RepID=A0A9X4JSW1_9FIRM|nr:hypothetical protein [Pelotomaculum isophthalicicum]MDF9407539.1 hypothetical protein [Pelotomaculum isophthalicicum JI]
MKDRVKTILMGNQTAGKRLQQTTGMGNFHRESPAIGRKGEQDIDEKPKNQDQAKGL